MKLAREVTCVSTGALHGIQAMVFICKEVTVAIYIYIYIYIYIKQTEPKNLDSL